MTTELINLDAIVNEVMVTDSQLFALHKKYGHEGMKVLERQVIEKGLVLERNDFDKPLTIRRRRDAS